MGRVHVEVVETSHVILFSLTPLIWHQVDAAEYVPSMEWYQDGVKNAIVEYKQKRALLVVYVKGELD